MKRLVLGSALLILALIAAGCGRSPIDEANLPTRVPTLAPDAFAVTVPTATPLPTVTPDPTATPTAMAVAETETEQADETAEAALDPEATADAATDSDEAARTDDPAHGEQPTVTPAAAPSTADADPADTDEAAAAASANEEASAATNENAADEPAGDADTETDAVNVPADALLPTPTATATPRPTATRQPTVTPTTAPEPTATPASAAETDAEAQVDPALAGLPPAILAAMKTADPARGQQLSLAHACIGCHSLDPNQVMAGPTWHDLANTAATRVEGESAGLYLYNSIIHPNDFIVPGYQPNIMLQIYENTLNPQQLADIIAYLLTLDANR